MPIILTNATILSTKHLILNTATVDVVALVIGDIAIVPKLYDTPYISTLSQEEKVLVSYLDQKHIHRDDNRMIQSHPPKL